MLFDPTGVNIIFAILAFIIALLNTVEAVLIIRCNTKRTFDKLLLSLAISDLLVGVAVTTFKIVDLATYSTISWLEGESFANIFIISINFSIANLIAITVDRFLAVRFPIKHRILLTERRVIAVIALIWFLGFISSTLVFVLQFKWNGRQISLLVISVFLLLLGVAMMMTYISIFYLIYKRTVTRAAVAGQMEVAQTRSLAMIIKGPNVTEKAVFITGGIVTTSFIICAYPMAIYYLIHQTRAEIPLASRFMILSNSLFNPFIYFFKNYLTPKPRAAAEVMEMN